jgi:ribonuclease BN (tRNA processing enzyme)
MPRVPATLELIPLGTGAAFGLPDQAQAGYLVRAGGTSVMLDMGSGTFNRLLALVDPVDLDAVVITHLHPDHLSDLLAARVYMAHGPGIGHPLHVHAPPGLMERLEGIAGGETWAGITAFDLPVGSGTLEIGELVINHAEVPHLPPTHALRVEHGGKSITYGADCRVNDDLPALAEGTDILVVESTFGTQDVPADAMHLNAREAGQIARAAGAKRLLLVHGESGTDREGSVEIAREAFGGPVEWARERHVYAA